MPAQIPDSEPEQFTAGETVQWTRSLPDYPAPDYTLKYALQRQGATLITLEATADGTQHAVTLSAATTAAYAPGVYVWTAFVESEGGTVRTGIGRGTISILPSPLAALGTTHASRTLALIEAAIEGRIPNGLETTNINGQELSRIPIAQLVDLQRIYSAKVASEANQARMAAGLGNRRNIYTRFTSPR